MNILIATQNAPLHLAKFLESFLNTWNKNNEGSVSIIIGSPYVEKNIFKETLIRIQLYGFNSFCKMTLKIITNTFLSMFFRKNSNMQCYTVKNVIEQFALTKKEFLSINDQETIQYVKENIDLIISIASPEIFKDEILEAPTYGCVNYHTSLLPKYRGRQPLFWALFNNENTTGITVHKMDTSIDKGLIIHQEEIEISGLDTLDSLYRKTVKVGPNILFDAIQKFLNTSYNFKSIKYTNEKLYRFPKKEDGKSFRTKGKKFI